MLLPGLLLTPVAMAASYDPDLTWRTLHTEHFNITFHGGLEQLAEEMADVVEVVYVEMTTELAWEPRRRTELVLVDNTDSANGYAMTLPVNTIVIFVTAPEAGSTLSLYEDWSDAIFTHEYTHILHLDTIEGLPRLLRAVMGRIISVNQISPGWIVEGQATFQETRHTPGGRGRSPYVDMIKRVTVLAGQFPPLGNMDGWQTDPPGGNLRYLFGQDFMQFVSDETGELVWTDWNHTYGGGVPYILPSKRVFGERLVPLYTRWKESVIARYDAQVAAIEAEGVTPFTLLSDGEDFCSAPTFSPDGTALVWSCSDPHTGSNIFLARGDGSQPEVEIAGLFADDFTWRADSEAFAYSTRRVVNRFNLYSDVSLHTVGGSTAALTSGDRARSPSFTTDGTHLLVVTNEAQNNQLSRLTVDRRKEPLTDNTDHTQYTTPRYSPDGRYVALGVWQDGQQDLWIYDAMGQPVRRVTADLAADIDPQWSADGRTLYFSSDRTGVYNIYAVDLESERLWQVTNVIGGAFRPSPSPAEQQLAFEYYDVNGTSIALMALDRQTWQDRGALPMPLVHRMPLAQALPAEPIARPAPAVLPEEDAESEAPGRARRKRSPPEASPLTEAYRFPGLTGLGGPLHDLSHRPGAWGLPGEWGPVGGEFASDQPAPSPDTYREDTIDSEAPEEEDYAFTHPVDRYNPLPTLLPPRFISPYLYQTAFGFMGVLSTSGTDTLRRYLYSAYASYRTDSRYIGWGVSAALNRWVPLISVGAYTYTVPYGDLYLYPGPPDGGGSWIPSVESANLRYWDKRIQTYAQVTHALSSYRTIFARWTGSYRSPWFVPSEEQGIDRGEPLPENAYRPFLPTRGFISRIGGGWRYAKGKYYSKSISPEDARILSLLGSISSPYIGSYTLDDTDQPESFSQALVTGEWREYRTVPWPEGWGLRNHVVALKLAGGAALGDSQRYGSFRLGGSFGDSAYNTLPDEWRALRGFPTASVYGDWYYQGSVEYRLPLWWIDRGVGTIPAFARYVSAAAFLDVGHAFDSPAEVDVSQTLVGTGMELQGSVILGWGIPLTGRLGYAFALNGSGYALGDINGAYAWLGTSF